MRCLKNFAAFGALLFSMAPLLAENPQADLRPLETNPVPEGLKEEPFKDPNPEIQPSAAERERGFALFTRPVTEPVYPQTNPLPSERVSSLSGFGAPGEFEPVNFAVYPLERLDNLRVSVSALKNGDSVIPPENLDLRLVTYRNILYPNYQSKDSCRKMPELLEKVTVTDAPAKEPQRYWLKIKIPDNAAPGVYTGEFKITRGGLAAPVSVPLSLRVLPFKLERDPAKNYTAYNHDLHRNVNDRLNSMRELAKQKGREWIFRAAENEYRAMFDYGFTSMPTLYLQYDPRSGEFYIIGGDRAVAAMTQAGLKGPLPVVGGGGDFYNSFMKKQIGPHCKIPEAPPEEFYSQLTEKIRKFDAECQAKGWPERVYVPLDEIDAAYKEFGVRVYKALKDAGVKTYATKDPKSSDARDYEKYLDYWCGQPFSAPYEEVIASRKPGYWCYPNHNSYEIKDPLVMCRGGRMTYGLGLWRSGYTLLIPWIWRAERDDYLKPGSSGGNRIDADGNIIPTVYWECFREGIGDGKYLYTLEKAIVQREDSKDEKCLKLVGEGKALVQEIWDSIQAQTKYLGGNVWDPREFEGYRWRMAQMIQKLLKYPPSNNRAAPSVTADHKAKSKTVSAGDFLEKQRRAGNIESADLGEDNYKHWKSVCSEAKISVPEKMKPQGGSNPVLFDVTVDHKTDGGGEKGQYPVGWPRMLRSFGKNGLDLTAYDYISLRIMVDSERDEVSDDFSPFYISVVSDKVRNLYGKDIINEVEQRVWTPVTLPVKDMIDSTGRPDVWKHINGIQFGISESKYKDGARLRFYLDNISLVKFKSPAVFSVSMPSTLILPAKTMPFTASLMGAAGGSGGRYTLAAGLFDESGRKTAETSAADLAPETKLALDCSTLRPGHHVLRLEIKDKNGKAISSFEKKFAAVSGPLSDF